MWRADMIAVHWLVEADQTDDTFIQGERKADISNSQEAVIMLESQLSVAEDKLALTGFFESTRSQITSGSHQSQFY